jgi:hypothetical protein
MLSRLVPLEVKAEADINSNGPGIGEVNIITVPPAHMLCPDGNFRPHEEAKALWDQHNAKLPKHDSMLELRPEPEVAAMIDRAIKSKPKPE